MRETIDSFVEAFVVYLLHQQHVSNSDINNEGEAHWKLLILGSLEATKSLPTDSAASHLIVNPRSWKHKRSEGLPIPNLPDGKRFPSRRN